VHVTKSDVPHKTCPSCAATLPTGTQQCECGYRFDSDETAAVRPVGELLAKAEALYESYLNARVGRARNILNAAKLDLKRDPRNRDMMAQVKRAEREFWVLETELAIQIAKTADARKKVKQARNEMTRTVQSKSTPALEKTESEQKDRSEVRPSPAASDNFRTTQALIAETALKAVKAKMAARESQREDAGADFRIKQVTRAEEALQKARAEQIRECPKCSTVVSFDSTRCQCGYAFPDTDEESQPFLTQEEISALRFLAAPSSKDDSAD